MHEDASGCQGIRGQFFRKIHIIQISFSDLLHRMFFSQCSNYFNILYLNAQTRFSVMICSAYSRVHEFHVCLNSCFIYIPALSQKGSTPLNSAASAGHIECVKLLLEANAALDFDKHFNVIEVFRNHSH